jgi:fucose permease
MLTAVYIGRSFIGGQLINAEEQHVVLVIFNVLIIIIIIIIIIIRARTDQSAG